MKPIFKLKDLIQQGESAIAATSTLIGQGMVAIDSSEVESLTEEQLTYLFSGIPDRWDFLELAEVFDTNTFSDALAQQFSEYCDRRHGRIDLTPNPSPEKRGEQKALDIFKLSLFCHSPKSLIISKFCNHYPPSARSVIY